MQETQREAAIDIPMGIAAPGGVVGVISNLRGGLDKLDLRTGVIVWHSAVGLHPLLISGDRVFVQVESHRSDTLKVISLDLETGAQMGSPYHFRFPAWSQFADPDCQDFRSRLSAVGSGQLVLDWTVQCNYAGGAAAPESIRKDKRKRIDGVSYLQLAIDRCETVPRTPTIQQPAFVEPRAAEESLAARVSYQMQGKWSDQPFESDGQIAQLTGDETSLYVIRREQSEGATPRSALLLEGSWFAPMVTPDGRFLVVQRRQPDQEDSLNWEVFHLVSGGPVCQFESDSRPESPCVVGTQLLHLICDPVGGVQYCARSLETGNLRWRKTLPGPDSQPKPPPLRR